VIHIKINAQGVSDLIHKLIDNSIKTGPAMKAIAGIMHDSVEENFAQQGRPRWAPWSNSTKRYRNRVKKLNGKILQLSGQLAASISSESSDVKAIVGTNKDYAAIHQFGGTIEKAARSDLLGRNRKTKGKNKGRFAKGNSGSANGVGGLSYSGQMSFKAHSIFIPARPFLGFQPQDITESENILKRHLMRGTGN
jgi:phage virion morphogenesis protein